MVTTADPSSAPILGRPATWAVWQQPAFLAALLVGLIFSLILPRLWVGNLLNSYSYMSDDSFDWVTQGVALIEFVSGEDRSQWPILRPPGFVLVLGADHLLGNHGIAFLIAQVGALASVSYAVAHFTEARGAGYFASLLAGLSVPFSILGFYAVWLLSDAIASSLMAISAAMVLNRLRNPFPPGVGKGLCRLAPAILLGVAAGITQTYGMIPMLVICSAFGGLRLLSGHPRETWAAPLLAALITGALGFGIQELWAAFIPHGMQPNTFSLLRPSLAMLPFYGNVWPLAFGFFVPILLWAAADHLRHRRLPGIEQWSLLAVVLTFALLSFAYQWPESRMTYIYVPLFILMVVSLKRDGASLTKPVGIMGGNTALIATFSVFVLATLTIVPGDYWHPTLANARFAPSETWLLSAISANPVDRYRLRIVCDGMDDFCDRATLSPQPSPYREMMVREDTSKNLWREAF